MSSKSLIASLEQKLKSRVICYATGDRQGQEAQIGDDAIPPFYEHLQSIGRVDRITLILYSRGGHTMSGFTLANALREFASDVDVLIPFRAHSCATLVSLSASKILMGPFGQLTPIDPSITTPHGPTIQEGQQTKFLPVSVEDVAGFFSLARKEADVPKEKMADVLAHLCQRVSPLALGAVFRAREQIGMLARKLLQRHLKDAARVDKVVNALTRELLSHDYIIGRAEAAEIGLPVEAPRDDVETSMWQLYLDLANEMKLSTPWNVEAELEGQPIAKKLLVRAVIDSSSLKHVFSTSIELRRAALVKDGVRMEGVQGKIIEEGWRRV